MNGANESALSYHKATCYSRFDMKGRTLDWALQPDVVKRYPLSEKVQLIALKSLDGTAFWDLCDPGVQSGRQVQQDLGSLSAILAMGQGVTCQRRQGQTVYTFRSAASAGALYPVDLYVDASSVEGLKPGLYHHNVADFALETLKTKKPEHPERSEMGRSPWAVIYVTGVFFRSSWKYADRAYRYILNDAGHVVANIVLASKAMGFGTRLDYDFEDAAVNAFLGIEPQTEVCLARIVVYPEQGNTFETEVSPCLWGMSCRIPDGDYGNGSGMNVPQTIRNIHDAGNVERETGARKKAAVMEDITPSAQGRLSLQEPSKPLWARPFGESLVARRSRRNYLEKPLERSLFDPMIDLVLKGFSLLGSIRRCESDLSLGFLSRCVDGLEDGCYEVQRENGAVFCLDKGTKTSIMSTACLEQRWLANASLHFLMKADIGRVEQKYGTRGYRYLMMDAGFVGQIIYLGAASLGLGCCGIGAFFDDEAATVMDGGNDESLLYLVASGHIKGNG